jgi:peroxiredoxin
VKRDPVIVVVVALIVSVMLVAGYKMIGRNGHKATGSASTNQIAPDFTLQSIDGKTIKLSDYRGKAILLNFWATWCEPCKIEMPWFADLQKQYGPQGLQVVGVSVDEDSSVAEVSKFAQELGVNYPILMGKESVVDAYGGVQFLPATLFINRDGKIVEKVFGLKGKSEIEDNIKKALTLAPAATQKSGL